MLEHYPHLEQTLIDISPTYKALRNPVLRRTVARVATLRQVSKVGNVPLAELIGRLRAAAGLEGIEIPAEEEVVTRPAWADPGLVVRTYDARADIESGKHPLPAVMKGLEDLKPGEVYLLVTSFAPEPLVDLARKKGFEAYSASKTAELVHTYFTAGKSAKS